MDWGVAVEGPRVRSGGGGERTGLVRVPSIRCRWWWLGGGRVKRTSDWVGIVTMVGSVRERLPAARLWRTYK